VPEPTSFARTADPARVARLLDLVETVLRDRLPDESAHRVYDELLQRADALGETLHRGINDARPDASTAWDDARAAAYAPTEHVGAVHLELGTWSAFPDGRVAELIAGDGLAEFIRLDADPQHMPEVVADATALPFASGVIDRVASNSVLEHIAHPHVVLAETRRVLRPGGVMVVVMPFVMKQHGYPDDHVRLTPGFFERILPALGLVDVHVDVDTSGGLFNVLHNTAKMASPDPQAPEAGALRELQELAVVLLGTLIPLDRAFVDGSRERFHSVRVLARAPGTYAPSQRTREASRPFAERALDLLADPESKRALRYERRRLVSDATGYAYPVSREGGVDFLQPQRKPESVGDRVRAVARRARQGRAASR
jgi:SAM-dependent methyltransferase